MLKRLFKIRRYFVVFYVNGTLTGTFSCWTRKGLFPSMDALRDETGANGGIIIGIKELSKNDFFDLFPDNTAKNTK